MNIEQYLRGKVDFDIPDVTMAATLYDYKVEVGTDLSLVGMRERDLALADLLMWCARSSTVSSGESESDGGWSRKKATKNVTDRYALIQQAKALYDKWGVDSEVSSGIIMSDLY